MSNTSAIKTVCLQKYQVIKKSKLKGFSIFIAFLLRFQQGKKQNKTKNNVVRMTAKMQCRHATGNKFVSFLPYGIL